MRSCIQRQTFTPCPAHARTGARKSLLALALGASLALGACADQVGSPSLETAKVDGELGFGASGAAVEAAQGYLENFGYFPNDSLAQAHPSWRPLVTKAPETRGVIDTHTQEALARFQGNMGLRVTGTLNAETLASMKLGRCGVPDGDRAAESRVDKFSAMPAGNRWTKSAITFRFVTPGGLGSLQEAQVRAVIQAGIKAWEGVTDRTFTQVTTGGDFLVSYRNIDGVSNILAQGGAPPSPGLIFDTSEPWTITSLLAVSIHEAGHLIGLNHSSFGDSTLGFPIMHPVNHNLTTFTDDDRIAANTLYNGWANVGGLAVDIGANSITGVNGDTVWILGTDKIPYRWNGSGWVQIAGVTGNRIDVDSQGHAVVVGTDGRIFRHQNFVNQPTWVELPGGGRAKDVGAGQDGSIWVVGTDGRAYVFNSNAGVWNFSGGPANQIAIDVGPSGQPFVVTSGNELWALGSSWSFVANGVGADVGIGGKLNGPGTRSWEFVLGTNAVPFIHDVQPFLSVNFPCGNSTCTSTAPGENSWLSLGGLATRISAGSRGRTYLVNSANQIFFRNELP